MINIKLDYFTLLSPDPIFINGVGNIKSPTLRDISKLEYKCNTYNFYVNLFLLTIDNYFEEFENENSLMSHYPQELKTKMLSLKSEYDSLSEEGKKNITFFNFLVNDDVLKLRVVDALNFFIVENVVFNEEHNMFVTYDKKLDDDDSSKIIGTIYSQNYADVIDIILQRLNIKNDKANEEKLKVKNKIAEKLLAKMKKASSQQKKQSDKKMTLANLISALSSHHENLNIVNIWDITVYQLYDQFNRTRLNDSYNILSTGVSVFGDKENKFDEMMWLSLINEN